ncbi:hypothetical protein RJ641_035772, partial [Dillenia turbinata]
PNAHVNAVDGGTNYASGASGIVDETGPPFIGRVPLWVQVDYFNLSRKYMVNAMGEDDTKMFLEKTIFSLTIGSNDILNCIQPEMPLIRKDKVPPARLQEFMI